MSHAKYGQAVTKDKVWELASPIKGKDSTMYRKDPYGNTLYYNSYGNTSEMGLQTTVNNSKSNSLVKASRHNKK